MLDQNITILLAALLGGFLSILGVFVANLASNRVQQKREIRNLLEQIYKSTQIIDETYTSLKPGLSPSVIEKRVWEIMNYMSGIDRRVDLYLSPIAKDFAEYKGQITSNIHGLEKIASELPSIKAVTDKFRESLRKMLKEKGYSYF
jgi:hypothetical protein